MRRQLDALVSTAVAVVPAGLTALLVSLLLAGGAPHAVGAASDSPWRADIAADAPTGQPRTEAPSGEQPEVGGESSQAGPVFSHRLVVRLEIESAAEWAHALREQQSGPSGAPGEAFGTPPDSETAAGEASGTPPDSETAAGEASGTPPDIYLPDGRLNLDAPAVRDHVALIAAARDRFLRHLAESVPEARVAEFVDESGQRRPLVYDVLMAGLAIEAGEGISPEDLARRISALPGVLAVARDRAHEPAMFSSLPLIGAPEAWAAPEVGGADQAGAGIRVASMDGGVHHAAPMFDGAGYDYPPGYPLGHTDNTNGKIIVSRAYFRDWDPPAPGDDDPWPGRAGTPHGVHTAGTAAGNRVDASYAGAPPEPISGVAPRAFVMSYRVFYESVNGIGSFYDAEGIASLEDIVRDGAHVLNNSWGGGPGSVGGIFDPLDTALINAWRAGVFVSMSAGNAGPGKGTGDHPSPEYMNVAASTKAEQYAAGRLSVVSPPPVPENMVGLPYGVAGFGPPLPIGATLGPYGISAAAELAPDNVTGCEPFEPGLFEGRAALISRGACFFSTKVYYAQEAGAVLAVIHNNADGGDAVMDMGAGDFADEVIIPSVFVGYNAGVDMALWHLLHGDAAMLEIDTVAYKTESEPDRIAAFSSRGPGVGEVLKPDIAAPGVSILSQGYAAGATGEARHLGFGQAGGTSMASPHVAGAAAVLRQARPDWSNTDIKSALMSTARYLEVYTHEGAPAQPLDMGSGRLQLDAALDPGVLLSPPSLSFGRMITGTEATLTLEVRSVAEDVQEYTLRTLDTRAGFTATRALPGMEIFPDRIRLRPGETATVRVEWDTAEAGIGDNQGWLVLTSEGYEAHLAAWMRVMEPPAEADVLLMDADGSAISEAVGVEFQDRTLPYVRALSELGLSWEIYDSDAGALGALAGPVPPAEWLARYPWIVYQTGDNFVQVPAETDQNRLMEYLNGGGRMTVFGQDAAAVVDSATLDGGSFFYNHGLGAAWLQDGLGPSAPVTETSQVLAGVPGGPLAGMYLDVSARGDGAGNQVSIDELEPDAADALPLLMYAGPPREGGALAGEGLVALAHRDRPTLEVPGISYLGRAAYFSFGLEGVADDTGFATRLDLLGAAWRWLDDEASLTLDVLPGPARGVSYALASLSSTHGGPAVSFRADFGDGSPVVEDVEARGADDPDAPADVVLGHVYEAPGEYRVRVEGVNALGITAVAEADLLVRDERPYAESTSFDIHLPWAGRDAVYPVREGVTPLRAPAAGADRRSE